MGSNMRVFSSLPSLSSASGPGGSGRHFGPASRLGAASLLSCSPTTGLIALLASFFVLSMYLMTSSTGGLSGMSSRGASLEARIAELEAQLALAQVNVAERVQTAVQSQVSHMFGQAGGADKAAVALAPNVNMLSVPHLKAYPPIAV
ncbi:MAG: hypothetical protein EOO41_00295, partial [Methanobacteriota archaeon]